MWQSESIWRTCLEITIKRRIASETPVKTDDASLSEQIEKGFLNSIGMIKDLISPTNII